MISPQEARNRQTAMEVEIPDGFDAMCAGCGLPFLFSNSRQCSAADPEKFCSGLCEQSRSVPSREVIRSEDYARGYQAGYRAGRRGR